jgi:hypothetical protein
MSEQKYKFDIFKLLERLSVKDKAFFDNMTPEDLKALQPLVLMRWMSGTTDVRQLFFLNELTNPMVFPLTKHKELLLDLLMISSSGKNKRYFWNKAKNNKKTSTPHTIELIKKHFGYSTLEAKDALRLLKDEDILGYAVYHGYQSTEYKAVAKELNERSKLQV